MEMEDIKELCNKDIREAKKILAFEVTKLVHGEEEAIKAICTKKINPGDVIVIRYEGPKGGPGMREMLNPTSAIMGMGLDFGGHLTHGSPANFSGKLYNIVPYTVDRQTERIDYDALEKQALEVKPKILLTGASAYPRTIDFKRIREICDKCGAELVIRKDDNPETVKDRLVVYHRETEPLIKYYEEKGLLRRIDGDQGPVKNAAAFLAAM